MESPTGLEAANFRDMLDGGPLSILILAMGLNQAIRTGQGNFKKFVLGVFTIFDALLLTNSLFT